MLFYQLAVWLVSFHTARRLKTVSEQAISINRQGNEDDDNNAFAPSDRCMRMRCRRASVSICFSCVSSVDDRGMVVVRNIKRLYLRLEFH